MPHLSVFLGNGRALNAWDEIGYFHREFAIYKKFVEDGWDVSFFTSYPISKLPDIGFTIKIFSYCPNLLLNRLKFLYEAFIPLLYFGKGKQTSVIIADHLFLSSPAIIAGRLWRAKVVARCGMVYGENTETMQKTGRRARKKTRVERRTFKHADKCLIPTKELADWVVQNYGIERSKIEVVPNYVETELFKPDINVKKDIDIICVGRLTDQKRYDFLLEALVGTKVKVHIIGQGKLEHDLNDFAKKNFLDLTMTQRVENSLLPFHFNRSKIYVSVSRWEGHPKAFIEAMACGCACIGARSPGIQNLIIDGKTGIVVDAEPQKIRDAVEMLLENKELREYLGKNARDYAVKHFSLEKVFKQYKKVFKEVLVK